MDPPWPETFGSLQTRGLGSSEPYAARDRGSNDTSGTFLTGCAGSSRPQNSTIRTVALAAANSSDAAAIGQGGTP